jgi:glycosyltransferase involved in cell wall biosynthesis
MREFYAGLHCFLAPSTGEGKNVPALEAQTTGVPVIGTDYGGHKIWMNDEWAYPLDWTPEEFEQGWAARPDEEHLKKLMWHVYTSRHEARQKGQLAARMIPQMCSWSHVIDRLMDLVHELPQTEPTWPP